MLLVLVLLAWGSLQDILHRASRQEPSDPEGKRVWESLLREAAEAQINGRIRMADQASFSNKVGVKWRPNFKLQFFRVSEPVAPTWTGADPKGTDDSFAHTGASEQQQAVWQSIYDWMKGEEKESASALSDGEVTRLSGLISTLGTIADEPQRIGSAVNKGTVQVNGSFEHIIAQDAGGLIEPDMVRLHILMRTGKERGIGHWRF